MPIRKAHNRRSHKEFERQLKQIHPYYKLLEHFEGQRKLKCKCTKHNKIFTLDKVNNVGSKQHCCPDCKTIVKRASIQKSNKQDEFEKRILFLFPDHKILGKYINVKTPVKAYCRKHKLRFNILPNNALYNKYSQCPGCRKNSWTDKNKRSCRTSKVSQDWLKFVCKQKGWNFSNLICSTNGKEHYIKEIGRVDGYHKQSNTVLEFHGDYWHGNPKRYKPNHETFTGIKAKDLYKKTKNKEARILAAGFNLITMWELDYRLLAMNS